MAIYYIVRADEDIIFRDNPILRKIALYQPRLYRRLTTRQRASHSCRRQNYAVH